MHIAIISDIHANFEALVSLADVLEIVDHVICLGDLVGYYCQVNEVLSYIRHLQARCVLGNHDYFLLYGCPPDVPPPVRFGIDFANQVIAEDHRRWLATLPIIWGGMFDGCACLFAHGSPWLPISAYVYPDSPAFGKLDDFGYDIIALGQTHRWMQRLEHKPYLINPGSVGQSRDIKARACALIVDTATLAIQRIQRAYDVTMVLDLAIRNGAADWIKKHLM
jgi:predicted phosphodiesterase